MELCEFFRVWLVLFLGFLSFEVTPQKCARLHIEREETLISNNGLSHPTNCTLQNHNLYFWDPRIQKRSNYHQKLLQLIHGSPSSSTISEMKIHFTDCFVGIDRDELEIHDLFHYLQVFDLLLLVFRVARLNVNWILLSRSL